MDDPGALGGSIGLVAILLVVLIVLWILLPFAIFGTKPILRDILIEQKQIRTHLERLTVLEDSGNGSGVLELTDLVQALEIYRGEKIFLGDEGV